MYNQRPQQRPQATPVQPPVQTMPKVIDRTEVDESRNRILNEIQNKCRIVAIMHQEEMHHCHDCNLQGFRKLHKHLSRKWMCKCERVMEQMVDYFHDKPMIDIDHEEEDKETELIIRFKSWHEQLHMFLAHCNQSISELESMKEYKASKIVRDIVCCIEEQIKFVHRHVTFIENCKSNMANLYWYSNLIEEKMKEEFKDL